VSVAVSTVIYCIIIYYLDLVKKKSIQKSKKTYEIKHKSKLVP